MMDDYSDIINLPRPVSKTRMPMSLRDRAAQFAPFAALTGYDEAIGETARLTDSKHVLSDEEARELNQKLRFLKENLGSRPLVTVRFFLPDSRKSGGSYLTYQGNLRRINYVERELVFTDDHTINIDDVVSIEGR